jgi:hypothetical protein
MKELTKEQIFMMYLANKYGTMYLDGRLTMLVGVTANQENYEIVDMATGMYGTCKANEGQLILRKFEDITEEEKNYMLKKYGTNTKCIIPHDQREYLGDELFELLRMGICLKDEWFKNGTAKYEKELK